MLAIVSALDAAWYSPRTYVVAATDALGPTKAAQAETALAAAAATGRKGARHAAPPAPGTPPPQPTVLTIPRSREVGQSYLTSVWTTLVALAAAVRVVWATRPDLLLVNGPGTCLPLVAAAVACR
jgi:beta-1,4-N-acetylglucosaminyltransferase